MARGIHKLTETKIAKLIKPGRYADGGGLYLQVERGGSKNWIYRSTQAGRDTITGLGSLRDIGLDEVRDNAKRMRGLIKSGGRSPQAAKAAKAAISAINFREAARAYAADHKSSWHNPVHRNQWFKHMLGEDENGELVGPEHDYCRHLHPRDVRDIGLDEVKAVLLPIWSAKPETARRIRGRIEKVLGWATTHGYRAGDNPARWAGFLENVLPSQSGRKVNHHRTLPYTAMPDLMARLKQQDGVAPKALRFTILTVVRTSSIRGVDDRDDTPPLDWSHIDLPAKLWTVPRVKNNDIEFVIPLSDAALDILREMHRLTGGKGLVFPGDLKGEPLSNNAMLAVLKRMKVAATSHGLARAGFETWADECSTADDQIINAVMSHGKQRGKLKAAYSRGQLLQKRRALMQDWADYLTAAQGRRLTVIAA
ncbi:tyrosine-type recombinase/integrase [Bradyrhizobium iriomotense]|nr:integrase arm-type DNA-binding domain-containing protein [Bradyrhizobium iriomotense]